MRNQSSKAKVSPEMQRSAFRTLLQKCMRLEKNEDLLVIYDETFIPFFDSFLSVIEADGVSSTFLFVPSSYQKVLVRSEQNGKTPLPMGISAAISNSSVILNLLGGQPSHASLRRTVNYSQRMGKSRLATIPGIDGNIIKTIVDSPIDDILRDCEQVAWIIGESHHAELISYDYQEHKYVLQLALGSWDNEPIMSPGIFLPGSWGNVPPGETFCCPIFNKVNGEICINGSVPGSVIAPQGDIVLTFEKGKLIKWTPVNPMEKNEAVEFFIREQERAVRDGDQHWNTFAELGIGLNPVISKLTGNALFDEKARHTIHVAIGDNSAFGDAIVSSLHADLVTVRPDLRLDGHVNCPHS